MSETQEDLHDELRALLGAGRELSPDADAELVQVFLDRQRPVKKEVNRERYWIVSKGAASHAFIGLLWLSAFAILAAVPYFKYYTHGQDVSGRYFTRMVPAVLIVALVINLTFLAANATEWRLPRIRVIIPPGHQHS
jgi:hypothetical protein